MSVSIDAQLVNQSGIGLSGEAILVNYSTSGKSGSTTITTGIGGFASGNVTVTPNTPYNFVGTFSGDANNQGSTSIVSGFSLIVASSGSTSMHSALLSTQLTNVNASGAVVGIGGKPIILTYTQSGIAPVTIATVNTDAGGLASGQVALTGGLYNFQASFAGDANDDPANAFYSGLNVTNATALSFTKVTLI